MQYTNLGNTGVQVSRLCMGTMTFGREADEKTSAALYRRCREAGINFFDCANTYAGGDSEKILGKLIRDERDELIITSKVGAGAGKGPNGRGLSRRHIVEQCERSLARMGTDRLDVYFAHIFDSRTPIDETLRAFDDLVRQGKILYPAASNWSAWQFSRAFERQAHRDWAPFAVIQPMYNLVKRQAEVEILPWAQDAGVAVIPYSPMGGGLLSGKYTRENRPDTGRMAEQKTYTIRYGEEQYYDVAERFTEHAKQRDVPAPALAVAWVMHHPAVTAPIIGARSLEQLEPTLQAIDIGMTPAWREEISRLSPAPPPPTDRSEEQ